MTMSETELRATQDAGVWARAFMQRLGERKVDEAFVIVWFANVIDPPLPPTACASGPQTEDEPAKRMPGTAEMDQLMRYAYCGGNRCPTCGGPL